MFICLINFVLSKPLFIHFCFLNSLRLIGSRLYVIQGKPEEQIPLLITKWGVELVTFEKDTEPYAVRRDQTISKALVSSGVKVSSSCSHTLFESEHYIGASRGNLPTTYVAFCKLFLSMGNVRPPIGTITADQVKRKKKNCIFESFASS